MSLHKRNELCYDCAGCAVVAQLVPDADRPALLDSRRPGPPALPALLAERRGAHKRRKSMKFYYTYVLQCSDGKRYVGSTSDMQQRLAEHQSGSVRTTSMRLPVRLIYYEACLAKQLAQKRERYFKTGFGRKFLKDRLGLLPL